MIKFFIVLWVCYYAYQIAKYFIERHQIMHAVELLVAYTYRFDHPINHILSPEKDCEKEYAAMMRYYPVMKKFTNYPVLSRRDGYRTTYENALCLLSVLQEKYDEKCHSLMSVINPLSAVKEVLTLPVSVVKGLGFAPQKTAALILNVFGWLITYFLDMFQPEIKALLISLF